MQSLCASYPELVKSTGWACPGPTELAKSPKHRLKGNQRRTMLQGCSHTLSAAKPENAEEARRFFYCTTQIQILHRVT